MRAFDLAYSDCALARFLPSRITHVVFDTGEMGAWHVRVAHVVVVATPEHQQAHQVTQHGLTVHRTHQVAAVEPDGHVADRAVVNGLDYVGSIHPEMFSPGGMKKSISVRDGV